ncbi:MAG: molecular chaperone HtpG [Ruminococcaceae bacterium]|nr:molecular chaperone HtpG [Oscillospiraceae bacterium]
MPENNIRKGGISVESAHIFPIIKKWLYSEKDIFLREIVSNATDAVTKLKRLESLGEIKNIDGDFKIKVSLDKDAKTLTVEDNGIGMTEDELSRYICQIALSGALEFIQKYEDESTSAGNGIIGHFGLGFYSSFMVSDTVEVITKSYTDAPALRWVCNAEGEYEIFPSERIDRGTSVIMHISDAETEYLSSSKIRSMLDKYCAFMPVDIYFDDGEENSEDSAPINDANPLWLRNPSDCKPEEYNEFYKKVFGDYRDPLFYVHINADYPLNFKGILFFPKLNNEFESMEGQVKLFYNQVFVADNIKEVIPDYLLMLKGVLDCPELPLNVSRSYLQNNTYVSKVSAHIVKKVADKLNSLCLNEREEYEKVWGDIRTFVEFACMRDKKFYDRVKPSLLLKLTNGSFTTPEKYLEDAKDKHENTVYYATDASLQAQYISMFDSASIKVAIFDKLIDTQFISMLESYESDIKYVRVDADIAEALKGDGEIKTDEKLADLFKEASGNPELKVSFEALKDNSVPAVINVSEQSRRMEEMVRLYSMSGTDMPSFPVEMSIILNASSPLITRISSLVENDPEKAKKIAKQVFYLSLISQRALNANEMKEFLSHSYDFLGEL